MNSQYSNLLLSIKGNSVTYTDLWFNILLNNKICLYILLNPITDIILSALFCKKNDSTMYNNIAWEWKYPIKFIQLL